MIGDWWCTRRSRAGGRYTDDGRVVHYGPESVRPKDIIADDPTLQRPDAETIDKHLQEVREKLEMITTAKIKAAQPKQVKETSASTGPTYIKYTSAHKSDTAPQTRIVRMATIPTDPLEPSRFRVRKIPRGNP